MYKLTLFTTEDELSELTGFDHDGLWGHGFDLDDWDFGFRVEGKDLYRKVKSQAGTAYMVRHDAALFLDRLAGCDIARTEHGGHAYYLFYHA